ncbi:MAG TPA: hypothetical protein VGO07_01690 [Candidatus Saccharimonadales bacterium]|nr:hypothetical protein [Candidatus Saccharimonadales bacterium]
MWKFAHFAERPPVFLSGNLAALTASLGAIATVLQIPLPTGSNDLQWLFGFAIFVLLALNAIFLRQVAKVFRDTVAAVRQHSDDIATLQEIGEALLTDKLIDGAGDPSIGRRKNDAFLSMLLNKLPRKNFGRRALPDNSIGA